MYSVIYSNENAPPETLIPLVLLLFLFTSIYLLFYPHKYKADGILSFNIVFNC